MTEVTNTVFQALLKMLDRAIGIFPGVISALILLFLTKYAEGVVVKIADETGKRAIKSTSLQLLLKKLCRIGSLDSWYFIGLYSGISWI